MDVAQIYMSLIRPTMVPVIGESADDLFKGQIELHGWSWNFHNEKEKKAADERAEEYTATETSLNDQKANTREIWEAKRELKELEAKNEAADAEDSIAEIKAAIKAGKSDDDLTKRLSDLNKTISTQGKTREAAMRAFTVEMNKALDSAEKSVEAQKHAENSKAREKTKKELEYKLKELQRNKNFEFTFGKRVDIASTQMLNSMKAGDVFPTAILTMHQSSNAGLTLVITVTKMRLLDYAMKVEVTDTMTDMKEEWTAEFASVAYVYKNRRSITSASGAGQAVAQAASQGTVRTFVMKNLLPF